MTVSPQVMTYSPSAETTPGFRMNAIRARSGTLRGPGSRAESVMIGPSSPCPRPCMFKTPLTPAAGPERGAICVARSAHMRASSPSVLPGTSAARIVSNKSS
jgi:hypothetical protein